jgi:hypothetical protein
MSADNPWLTIPLADYEAHMALPQVGQAQLLADLFAAELRARSPASVAVLGCAGGNGFEHAPAALRVVGIEHLAQIAARSGLRALGARTVTATGGKRFAVQSFSRG